MAIQRQNDKKKHCRTCQTCRRKEQGQWEVISVQLAVISVQLAVGSDQCSVFSWQCSVGSVQLAVANSMGQGAGRKWPVTRSQKPASNPYRQGKQFE